MPDDDPKLDALALALCAAGHVVDLREAADETSALIRELLALPELTATDLTPREAALGLMLWSKTEAAKRLLALVASGM